MWLLFWGASAAVVYTYALFPIIVLVRSVLRPRPVRSAEVTPTVSIVIAAHNEAGRIGRKIEALLAQDYPHERLEIVVASDGSEDDTEANVRAFADRRVTLVALPRVGKAAALEAAVAATTGDILVFSDANSMFASQALRRLVRPFADPEVGGVAGNQIYERSGANPASAIGERAYWDFDRWLKLAAARAGNVISGTGAIYAIRRELFRPIPPDVNDDLFESLCVVAAGRRLAFTPDAVAYETVAETATAEFGRRVRIMTRGLRCVAVMRGLLDPRRTGFYAVQLLTQKVLMRTMAVPLLAIAVSSTLLSGEGWLYRLATVAQAAFYGAAAAGLVLPGSSRRRRRLLALPAYFVLVNVASLKATWNLVRGTRLTRWEPARGIPGAADRAARAGGPTDEADAE